MLSESERSSTMILCFPHFATRIHVIFEYDTIIVCIVVLFVVVDDFFFRMVPTFKIINTQSITSGRVVNVCCCYSSYDCLYKKIFVGLETKNQSMKFLFFVSLFNCKFLLLLTTLYFLLQVVAWCGVTAGKLKIEIHENENCLCLQLVGLKVIFNTNAKNAVSQSVLIRYLLFFRHPVLTGTYVNNDDTTLLLLLFTTFLYYTTV
jgi:hypothetical protein